MLMNEKVVNVTGQALELGCTMLRAVPRDFPQELLLSMQNKSIEIRWLLRNHFDPLQIPFEEQFKQWEKFYQDVLGISLGGWEHIHIPERQYGFNRLVIVAGGLDSNVRPGTLGFINEKVAGVSWEREASEQIIEINQRGSDNDRAMWVRDELAQKCPVRNTVNLSAEVGKKRMIDVGVQILESDRMYYPIHVARIKDGGKNDGKLECISGRHRLAFYALVYGPDTKIPVYLEEMTTNEARDAVVFANQSRATKALEKAEHSVLQAVQGDVSATLEDMYTRTVTCKSKIRRYCVFSVINRGLPMKLSFPVSTTSTRKGGYLTTLANVEGFWRSALEWTDGTTFKDFDASLKSSVKFLNALVDEMQKVKGFKSTEHLATKQLVAIGKYYRSYGEFTGNNAIKKVAEIAKCIVKQGDIGGQKSEKTYAMLTKSLVFGKGK